MSVTSGTKRKEGGVSETVRVVFHALIIALVIRTFLFQPFNIPSGSMKATLLVGDYLFVSKYSYGYSHFSLPLSPPIFSGRVPGGFTPERGDVVVFRLPRDTSIDYIKRIIGLPGDHIQVKDGQLYINSKEVPRALVSNDYVDSSGTAPVIKREYSEALPGGKTHMILKSTDEGWANNTPEFDVPPGHVFAMGDNRDDSQDSRFDAVGPVPVENLVGRAEIIFFSIDATSPWWEVWEWPFEIRWSRLFTVIH